jgi:hypothetical protein
LKDYLKIFEGVRVLDLSAGTTSELAGMMGIEEKGTQEAATPKKRQKAVPKKAPKKKGGPYSIDEVNKIVEMSVFHQILFIILFVDGKTEGHTDEEIADVTSTAVSMGDWFDKDEDECWEVLEETFEVLQKCGELFTEDELDDIADECCFSIHENVTNSDARNDIIRFITDQANADGEVSSSEKLNSQIWAMKIMLGRV